MEILGHIHDHGRIATLAGQTGAAAPGQHGGTPFPANSHGCHDVLYRARDHHADGHLTVVGTVSGVECPAALVKADFPRNTMPQFFGQHSSGFARKLAGLLPRMRVSFPQSSRVFGSITRSRNSLLSRHGMMPLHLTINLSVIKRTLRLHSLAM
jgi:hypothetical protein